MKITFYKEQFMLDACSLLKYLCVNPLRDEEKCMLKSYFTSDPNNIKDVMLVHIFKVYPGFTF